MQLTALLAISLAELLMPITSAAPATAGIATLQFEIDFDTYTSDTEISVPGELTFEDGGRQLMGATIADVSGAADERAVTCQAFNGQEPVGEPLTLFGEFTMFNFGEFVTITGVTCG